MRSGTPPRLAGNIRDFVHHTGGEQLSCTVVSPVSPVVPGSRVVLMHGAGTGSKARMLPLARDFAAAGYHALAFDFSGHGDSSGELSALSLERRFLQARSVIGEFTPDGGPLVLVGFSMSGQTIADLVADLGSRVGTVVLGAPAAYAPEAWKIPFGSGFTEILRTPQSWLNSPVFDTYAEFAGRAALIVPDDDRVIPPGVTLRIEAALRRNSRFTRVVFPGSPHTLGQWLSEHPADRAQVVSLVTEPPPVCTHRA